MPVQRRSDAVDTTLGIPILLALADWLSVARGWRIVEFVAKPATLLALLVWFASTSGYSGTALAFEIGLGFSLLGDIFLMLAKPGLFLPGLIAFLSAHIAYIIALNVTLPPPSLATLLIALIIICPGLFLYKRIASGLVRRQAPASLRMGVFVYSLAISFMAFSALVTLARPRAIWPLPAALLTALGGLLFYTSDTILAFNRFVSPISNGRLWNMITYHLGQILLTVGIAIFLTQPLIIVD